MGIAGIYRSRMWGQHGWWSDEWINILNHPTVRAVASSCNLQGDDEAGGFYNIHGWGVFDEQTQQVIDKGYDKLRSTIKCIIVHMCVL